MDRYSGLLVAVGFSTLLVVLLVYAYFRRQGTPQKLAFTGVVWLAGVVFAVLSFLSPVSPDISTWSGLGWPVVCYMSAVCLLAGGVPPLTLSALRDHLRAQRPTPPGCAPE